MLSDKLNRESNDKRKLNAMIENSKILDSAGKFGNTQ